MSTSTPPPLLSVHDVAHRLGVAVRTVWRLHATGKLPSGRRIGPRAVRWEPADIEQFVKTLPPARGSRTA